MLNNITSYTIYLTNNCMLRCPYCYEKNKREREGLYIMPFDDIKAIIDFAITHQSNNTIEISLFGGEPLFYLKEQVFPVIEYLKNNCENFILTIMSNGFNLTSSLIEKLNELDNWFVLISLDGPYDVVKNQINKNAYNHIINNIQSIPEEIRSKHIGLKATLSDETIPHIEKIYNFLNNLGTNLIYLSPTQEIDKEKIKTSIHLLGKEKISLIRDGLLLENKYCLNTNLELFFNKGKIFLRGHSYGNLSQLPCGWIKNSKISISEILIAENLKNYPQLLSGKLALTPENVSDCNSCPLKNLYCQPQKIKQYNHLATTGCLWYRSLKEELDGIS